MGYTRRAVGWLSAQAGAGWTAELLLLWAWMFPWSNLEEIDDEQEARGGMRMESSLCVWRPHPHSSDAGNKTLPLALG